MEMNKSQNELSNSNEFIDLSLQLCTNISRICDLGGLANKMKRQQVVFTDGIGYDCQNSSYRTTRTNFTISRIAQLARDMANKKRGNSSKVKKNSLQVPNQNIISNFFEDLELLKPFSYSHQLE